MSNLNPSFMMHGFKTILLVDDDAPTNFLNRVLLEEWEMGAEIFEVENGKEALDFLQNSHVSTKENSTLILLDINMPVMNGFEFMSHFQNLSQEVKNNTHVVLLSTSLHPEDQQRASQCYELKGYLNKPLSQEKLAAIFPKQLSN